MQQSCIAETIIAALSLRTDHPCDFKQRRVVEKTIPINQILLHVTLELLIHLVANLLSSIYREKPGDLGMAYFTMHQHSNQCSSKYLVIS